MCFFFPQLRLKPTMFVLVLFPAERSCRPESRAWKHSPERRDAGGPHPARFLPGRLPLLPMLVSTPRTCLLTLWVSALSCLWFFFFQGDAREAACPRS